MRALPNFQILKNKVDILISEGFRPSIYGYTLKRSNLARIHINILFGDFLKIISQNKAKKDLLIKAILREIYADIDLMLANSSLTKQRIVTLLGINSSKVRVCWPILEHDFFNVIPNHIANTKIVFQNKIKICHLSRLRRTDGIALIPIIYQYLRNELNENNFEFHIIGYGPMLPYLIRMKKKEAMKNLIIWGYKSLDFIGSIYKSCTIFIYPAIMKSFGLPVIEAMSAGIIPVVTINTGARDFVKLVDKSLVTKVDARAIADVVLKLATETPSVLAELGIKSKSIARRWSRHKAKEHLKNILIEHFR